MAFKGFGGNSGPVAPPKMAISFGLSTRSSPSDTIARSNSPPPKLRHRPRSTPSPTRSPSPPPSTKPQLNEMRAKTPPNSIPGRSRSPPPTKQIDSSRKTQVDEREIEAKARRLARFNTDLRPSSPLKDDSQKKSKEVGELDEGMDEDGEAILGSCSDMCPELEREERERKGDLDKFERLHGDRNLTSKDLAVKKYNRTAEREAVLIRPLPVLQMTVDYLLNLLSRPYDDDFLSMHNFLWDRMRAIRMDLRMQHIFNWDAIAMHEQMIRFHIVAMHELCEYTKGEGFSEGFDAHLNIEQMNKTSVELFQMYDDHRKQGNPVPSEQEFRGYYALLKLDKHPGYKVEPAELSLDLAKMTSEIRNTHEVLFARDVARACRSGNYMAFFRLARKATYLQACLMHAHFAKLRTQALASLHSALQKNQGIPVIQVEKWLGMEGEDIEGLLEYHGFSIKQYEDAYMVKEGPFLKSDRDFPTKCSQLVHQKRSAKVVDDVISSSQMPIMDSTWHSVKALDGSAGKLLNSAKQSGAPAAANVVSTEEEMPDYEEDEQPSDDRVKDWQMQEMFGSPKTKEVTCMEEADKVPHSLVMPNLAVEFPTPRSIAEKHTIYRPKSLQEQQPKKKRRNFFPSELDRQDKRKVAPLEGEHLGNVIEMEETARPLVHASDKIPRIEKVASQCIITEAMCLEKKEAGLALHRAEAESSKLKLLLRRWKRRAAKNAQSRRLRKMKADAALSSLSLGPPVRPKKVITPREEVVAGIPRCPRSLGELNIDQLIRERRNRHERMWSKLDVADVIAPIISERNPQAKCLCWKLLICSETKDKVGHATGTLTCSSPIAGRWLRTKLMSDVRIDSEGLLLSTPDTAISRKWVGMPSEYGGTRDVCCLSIVQDMAFKIDRVGSEDASLGASGLLFLLLEDVQWDLERARLQSLVRTVPPGSNLPLLILSSANVAGRGSKLLETAGSPSLGLDVTIEKRLELHNLDRTRISSWSVIFIAENQHTNVRGFLSDDCLREGLLWLARQAPLQPIVYPSNVRDLILEYLDPYMKVLLNRKPSEVMPNDCIHIFNKALDQTASEIISAAQNSLLGWPPPEIDLLDENLEVRVIKSYLPKFGWNMASNFETIVHALRLCRLPQFPSVSLSSVSYGSQSQELLLLNLHSERSTLKEIEEQKVSLEKSLYQYLSQISLTRKGDLMTLKETDLMVQKNTVLQCIGLKHFIIPKWAAIFRRIYNWRLMLLASEPAPIAYVSRPRNIGSEVDELKHQLSSAHRIFMTSGFDHPVQPSLNEMVEVSSRDISRGLRFGPSMQIVKDQFMQHAWEGDAETSLKSVVTEVPKYLMDKINGQCKAIPMQLSFRNSLVPGKGIVRNEEYRIPDLDDVQHTIEFSQTDEEIQLDRVVNEFCNKVNEQIRWTTSAIERANIRNSSARVEAAARQCMGENVFLVESGFTPPEEVRRPESNGSQSLPSEIGHRTTISTPTWATGDGMDDLTKLLEQCSAVQSSIDKRLGVYFNERNGFQFG